MKSDNFSLVDDHKWCNGYGRLSLKQAKHTEKAALLCSGLSSEHFLWIKARVGASRSGGRRYLICRAGAGGMASWLRVFVVLAES